MLRRLTDLRLAYDAGAAPCCVSLCDACDAAGPGAVRRPRRAAGAAGTTFEPATGLSGNGAAESRPPAGQADRHDSRHVPRPAGMLASDRASRSRARKSPCASPSGAAAKFWDSPGSPTTSLAGRKTIERISHDPFATLSRAARLYPLRKSSARQPPVAFSSFRFIDAVPI